MLRSGSPGLVRQELAAWAAANEMTRGVARAAALAAAPARKGRRAGQRVQAREFPRPHPPRRDRRDPRRENQLYGTGQGTRGTPHRHRPEQAPAPQGQVRQHVPRAGRAGTATRIAAAVITLANTPPDQRKHRKPPQDASSPARGTGRHPA